MSVTLYLIITNVVISLAALYFFPAMLEKGMMIPHRVFRQKTWYELISSGFLHAGIGHLFLNMFVLFFFGPILEQAIGQAHFLMLYFSGLIASSLPSLIMHRDNPGFATLGASGAVESVLFGFILLYPLQPVYIMFIPIGIPSIIFGISFLIYSIYASKGGGKINHEAHIAGALWGIIYLLLFVPESFTFFMSNFNF